MHIPGTFSSGFNLFLSAYVVAMQIMNFSYIKFGSNY